jgi:hypothetical protein
LEGEAGIDWPMAPDATFGYLGEMKGFANTKPEAKFHPKIIALLELPMIVAVVGGGYMVSNNFQLSDLPEDLSNRLRQIKPILYDTSILYQFFGWDAVSQVARALDEKWYNFRLELKENVVSIFSGSVRSPRSMGKLDSLLSWYVDFSDMNTKLWGDDQDEFAMDFRLGIKKHIREIDLSQYLLKLQQFYPQVYEITAPLASLVGPNLMYTLKGVKEAAVDAYSVGHMPAGFPTSGTMRFALERGLIAAEIARVLEKYSWVEDGKFGDLTISPHKMEVTISLENFLKYLNELLVRPARSDDVENEYPALLSALFDMIPDNFDEHGNPPEAFDGGPISKYVAGILARHLSRLLPRQEVKRVLVPTKKPDDMPWEQFFRLKIEHNQLIPNQKPKDVSWKEWAVLKKKFNIA